MRCFISGMKNAALRRPMKQPRRIRHPNGKGGFAMGLRTTHSPVCHVLRAVKDWRERRETVEIQLDPCGHVVRRSARLEWRTKDAAA